ncbi:MAG: ThiF family adenylyltransferase [Nitrospira sp. NTP1]|nr:ThiF family adenylyltransferase [Nitrospira sp. NTP1]
MSARLIARSADLKRLQDEGYEIEVRSGFLIVRSVPYVTSRRTVDRGTVVTDLALNDDITQKPKDHQVWFAGEQPCHATGAPITALGPQQAKQTLCDGVVVDLRFSAKADYPDYYAKITQYVEILSNPAKSIKPDDPAITAQTFRPIEAREEDSVFVYTDSATSRAGIVLASVKLAMKKIAIVGLGGTGSYVLDLVAKSPVIEIHLFDSDRFIQHNAFRSPGAASMDDLRQNVSKVEYYTSIYSRMRRGVIPHRMFISDETIDHLKNFDFVFVCIDRPTARKLISNFLTSENTPFIDVGMELELIDDQASIVGACRVTLSTPGKRDHFPRHVSLEGSVADDLYGTNIQVADMNALNAALAVLKWKKFCGFYQDCYQEHQSVYAINAHQLTRDETGTV